MKRKIFFESGISCNNRKYSHLVFCEVKGKKNKISLGDIYVDSHNIPRFIPYNHNFDQLSLDEMTAISYRMSQLDGNN